MKCAVLSFWVGFLSFSFAFSQERTNLIIQKNTEVSLSSLVSPVLDSEKGTETFYLSSLYLGEGAKLYINRSATINAKKIILKPKSTLHTLGNSLTLKTDVFEALNFQPPGLNLSEDQRKELMGRIDTRTKEEKHQGQDGQSGQGGRGKGEDAHLYMVYPQRADNPQNGFQGADGEVGQKGRNAGSIILTVKKFWGGYFDARGGDGGKGGNGEKGGAGGNGLRWGRPSYDPHPTEEPPSLDGGLDDLIWPGNSISPDPVGVFMHGVSGGTGGNGGAGGDGGKGGAVIINCEEDSSTPDRTFFVFSQGGKGGERGEGGLGGDGGNAGKVPLTARGYHLTGKYWFYGKQGTAGTAGTQGSRGTDGVQGARQVQKYDSQN